MAEGRKEYEVLVRTHAGSPVVKLTDVGVRVLRFAEADVLADLEIVVRAITAEVNKPFDKRAARRQAAPRFEGAEG